MEVTRHQNSELKISKNDEKTKLISYLKPFIHSVYVCRMTFPTNFFF